MPNTLDKSKKPLDADTRWFVVDDLMAQARALTKAADIGLLTEADVTPRVEVLRAMSKHYEKMWSSTVDAEEASAVKVTATEVKRPCDFMSQAVALALSAGPIGIRTAGVTADAVIRRMVASPSILRLLPHPPTKANVQETLSAGSRGQNPRYIRVKQGQYKNNPDYKRPK